MVCNRVKFENDTIITVFGASGDLAKKKTFPALFGLFREGYLHESTKIFGFARSKLTNEQLRERIEPHLEKPNGAKDDAKVENFFKLIQYHEGGAYDEDDGYLALLKEFEKIEKQKNITNPHRLYYLALPPSVFLSVASQIKKNLYTTEGVQRVIVEKPFGHDLESARALQNNLAPLFTEDEIYRIDHYLGKEMVKNLLQLRFGNTFLNASWNKDFIQNIQVTFKEPFGTEGRGGYFDSIGIVRDVMQNHLLQILTLLTMERPVSFDPEDVRDEKVKVLKAMAPIDHNDILVGQYGKSDDGSKPAYLDDETVKPDSKCVTYCAMSFKIENERWDGVPIVMRAGKALNEAKVEIRIQYKPAAPGVFKYIPNNELVIRVQPDASVYMKMNAKTPGLSTSTQVTDLDLTYSTRFKDFWIPQAYEVLIRDALLGDHSNFVRDDELEVSWSLFTPFLEYIESEAGPKPEIYPYGSRGPSGFKDYMVKHGYHFQDASNYTWPVILPDAN